MKTLVGSLAGLLVAAAGLCQPVSLRNAAIRAHETAPGRFAADVRRLAEGPAAWIGWAAPIADRRSRMCCFDSVEVADSGRFAGTGRCRLDEHGGVFQDRGGDRAVRLEEPERFTILVRAAKGRVERIRSFSYDCAVDAGGAAVAWVQGVAPAESVAFLASLLPTRAAREEPDDDEDSEPSLADSALSAIAFHAGAEADRALAEMVAPSRPRNVRRQAAFWLGNARGRAGFDTLRRVIAADSDTEFRKHGTFALSQSAVPEAVPELISMARRDRDPEVRGQALFWLAQKAGRRASAAITDAIRDDPETEVKKKAVFALTQMPENEGVPELIRVARTNRNPAVREQAIFWLGQSKDPRALAFIEEVLMR